MTLAMALVFGGEMERVSAGAAADFSATRAWVCGAEAIVRVRFWVLRKNGRTGGCVAVTRLLRGTVTSFVDLSSQHCWLSHRPHEPTTAVTVQSEPFHRHIRPCPIHVTDSSDMRQISTGPGLYCGNAIAKDANYLYECNNGVYNESAYCEYGCFEAKPGIPDACRSNATSTSTSNSSSSSVPAATSTNTAPELFDKFIELSNGSKTPSYVGATFKNVSDTDTSCPFGEGDYCGETVGKDPKMLWTCTGFDGKSVEWKVKENCALGCKAHDDSCHVSPNATCPYGDGLYCGGPLNTTISTPLAHTTLHHLYHCLGGALADLGLCSNGCETTDVGENDFCKPFSHKSDGFRVNAFVLQKIKAHEGFTANFASDDKTPPTQWIGYGHLCLPTISQSDCATIHPPILEDEATALLSKDVKAAEDCVCHLTKTDKLNDNQFGALVDFVLSDSCDTYHLSRTRTAVNRGEFLNVPKMLLSYDTGSPGLQNRHRDQGVMWDTPGTGKAPC
ncbi:hypothetical protein BC937DRAFT_90639 [Endogone sp. FLAS-F59071]|nr:hypothetical protein BC937DRAFT_90639 [Endogone sp. FLAS-F59071]|eukprot:RUS16920.1 hypothetical protein BC937DRAFT_90639 [Endogone sp. FLAS-F59071]